MKNDKSIEVRESLASIGEELEKMEPGQFIYPYKGYIVNQLFIRKIEPEAIILKDGQSIPIPKRGFRKLKTQYFDFMFQHRY